MNNKETIRNVFVGVDIQNDFVDGSLAVTGGEAVIDPANTIAREVRESGGTVAWTRDWHPAQTPHFDNWPVHCVAETGGAEFHAELDIHDNDTILSKGMEQTDGYSGWEGVGKNGETLESLTAPRKERVRIFIGGLATDYCVKATAIDVADHYVYDTRVATYLIRDAVRAVGLQSGDEKAALDTMHEAGVQTISSQDALQIMRGTE